MNTTDIILSYLMPLAIAMLLLSLPLLSRGSTFFAVTVPEGFPRSDVGTAISRRYRIGTLGALLLSLAAITPLWWWIDSPDYIVVVHLVGTLGVTFGAMATFVHCRNIALRYTRDHSTMRSATLAPPDRLVDVVPHPLWLHALPYAIPAAAAAWLAMHFQQIPDPIVLSTGPDGPASLLARSWSTVFALPLLMLGTLILVHAVMALGLWVRRLPGHQSRIRSINLMLLWMMLLIGLLGAWNSLSVLYGPQWVTGLPGSMVNLTAALLILLIPVWMGLSGRLSRPGRPAEGDRSPDHCWKLGLFYFNPDDPALWVEVRFGVGYTVNFARPLAWVLLGVVMGLSLVILMVSLL